VAEAKAKFSELLKTAQRSGPQTITKNGRAAAVVPEALPIFSLALHYAIRTSIFRDVRMGRVVSEWTTARPDPGVV